MSPKNALPFPRGGTASDWGQVTLDDTTYDHLEGKIFEVPDTVHGTGQLVKLRAVKNDSGSAITVARAFMGFSKTSAHDFGRRCNGTAAAGAPCKPMDDAYTVGQSIPDDDIFFVVEEGPCYVKTEASAVALTGTGNVVASDASGLVNGTPCAQATEYAAGTIDAAAITVDTDIVVRIEAGLHRIGT